MTEFEAYFGSADSEKRKKNADAEFKRLYQTNAILNNAVNYGLTEKEIIIMLVEDRQRLIDTITAIKFTENVFGDLSKYE